ncbi:uncharacterized protein PEAK3 [Takifugu rubripes]|uniref:uncharacterized protein PEAK3 n=1 Tax=Takifugu rubripes TaxID=31033 RepID=UPI001145A7A7|nr:uncharacterized protein PEAK3 [Takifugu rubripes]
MASGPEREAAEQPPVLPVKQRRSRSSGSSSVESNWLIPNAAEEQPPCHSSNDVFPEPVDSMDCQAVSCPIHQRYGPARHQVRFYSDATPPPIPKKRLARTVSLPDAAAPPLPPLSPLPSKPPKTFFHDQDPPIPSLSELSFDTPDEHLPHLFRNFEDQRVVFQGIQHRQTLFLQSVARSIDAGILVQEGAPERDEHQYLPEDFLLHEGSTNIGGTVYYSLCSPKLPGRELALRVQKQRDQRPPTDAKQQHVNVQHAVAHFQPQGEANLPPNYLNAACSVTNRPVGGGTCNPDHDVPSVRGLLLRGYAVSVERDRPHLTLEEFVEKSPSEQNIGSVDHHRQLCVLLLQIITGSQHLYNTSGRAAELRPAEIMLVWPPKGQEREAVQSPNTNQRSSSQSPRRRGPPRVVLSLDSSYCGGPHPLGYIKTQIGALIQYCLSNQENLTSSYQHGLIQLASELRTAGSGLQMADAAATLQVLLWGPRLSLLDHRFPVSSTVQNWLTTKRALLVLKLAERGLVQDGSALDWEDGLCIKYLSSTDGEVVVRAVLRLWPPLDMD